MKKGFDILVTLSTFGEYSNVPIRLLEESPFSYEMNNSECRISPDQVVEMGGRCIGFISGVEKYTEETMSKLPELRCISRCGTGIDNIDLNYAQKKSIAILNTPDVPTDAVSEFTLAMILALLRRLTEVNDHMRQRKWQRIPGRLLSGKTVGIIGLGRIGRRVAELAMAFNARVIGVDPHPDVKWLTRHGVEILDLPDLLRRSDIVTIHAAGASEMPLLLRTAEFAAMKKGALLINMARGEMIDDGALFDAIDTGHLGGVGLDVYPSEPYTGQLCGHPKAILSPHQATLTIETRISMETEAVKNLVEHLKDMNIDR